MVSMNRKGGLLRAALLTGSLLLVLSLTACELSEEDMDLLAGLAEEAINAAATEQALQEGGGEPVGAPVEIAPLGDPSEAGILGVYFTSPVIPFDDVIEGGIDTVMVELIDSAQSSIDIVMFEFSLQSVADALIRAHERGVQVRIVYDDEHTEEDPQIEEVLEAGIPGTPDERSAFMHNKFMVIDQRIVWMGSTNFTINDVYRNNNNSIAFVSPELAANYTNEFEEMFGGEFGPTSPANTPYPSVQVGGILVENYFSPDDGAEQALINLVAQAQQSIHIMIFSYTYDAIGDAVLERFNAGVEVAAIFEGRGANTEYSECPRMLAEGMDARVDSNPRTFHHKVIIVDGQIVATGSFNFSENATNSNDENLVIIHSPEIAQLYEEEFARQMALAIVPQGGECLEP